MKRLLICGLICGTAVVVIQTGAQTSTQSSRESYRSAYDLWRQTQDNLEHDVGTGGPPQVAQADRAASAVKSFEAARIAYLKSAAQDAAQRHQPLQTAATRPSPELMPKAVADLATAELQTITRAIARFATDKDRGIQQLRQSLEREKVALTALTETIQARQKTADAAADATTALDGARAKTAAAFGKQASDLATTVAQLETESAAWAMYYDKLAEAIQIANAPPPPSPTSVSTAAPPADIVPRVPLVRYVGEWAYPMTNGVFHGAQPDSVAMEVREQNGHATGTFLARFKSSAGVSDPTLRFTFEGDFATAPTQRFSLTVSDGTPGVIELIPGPAFNLLEVNFRSEAKPGKVRTGNFILLKK